MIADKKEQIKVHLQNCKECALEAELLLESPDLLEDDEHEPVMPFELLHEYRSRHNREIEKVSDYKEEKPVTSTFWEKLRAKFLFSPRYAAATIAISIVFAFMSGFFLNPVLTLVHKDNKTNVVKVANGQFIQYPLNTVSEDEIDRIVDYLSKKGIAVYKKDSKLWVKNEQIQLAFGLMVNYQNFNSPGSNVQTVSGVQERNKISVPVRQPEDNKETLPMVIASGDRRNIKIGVSSPNPEESRQPGEKLETPVISDNSQGSPLTSAGNYSGEAFPESGGILSVTFPGEKELFRAESVPVNNKEIRSHWEIRSPMEAMMMHHEALTSSSSLIGADLKERESVTGKIQNSFHKKITDILAKYPDLSDCLVYVTVSLDFEKNQCNVYPIRGVKITIITRKVPTTEEKISVKEKVKKSLGWRESWDGEIEFASP
jgi:hypothetical protein